MLSSDCNVLSLVEIGLDNLIQYNHCQVVEAFQITSIQARNQLGTPRGAKCFLRWVQIF